MGANVAIGVGAAALVGGGVLYFLSPKRAQGIGVAVAPTPRGSAVRLSYAF
jgi:hypothetical protein